METPLNYHIASCGPTESAIKIIIASVMWDDEQGGGEL